MTIGLSASASLGFAFGPVSGQVAVMIGVAVEYHRRPGQSGGGLAMSLNLLILGRVDVLSSPPSTCRSSWRRPTTNPGGSRLAAR